MHPLHSSFFGWLLVVCIFLMTVIYPLRKVCQYKKLSKSTGISRVNRLLRKQHKPVGIAAIILAVVHGILSFQFFGFNTGTACFAVMLVLLLSYLLRRKLKKHWLPLHRWLTLALWILIILHIFIVIHSSR